ncbi:hypothetical protein AB0I61_03340 [Polymorphospora rubra]|uniref:hypothetical protein n=1 Tax=Polymorphospora rubra TaxID=338584 RepID=UPI0033F1549B
MPARRTSITLTRTSPPARPQPGRCRRPRPVRRRNGPAGRRITLTTEGGTLIAETSPGPSLHGARPSALIDPLNVELSIAAGSARIDPRAVGPYRLTDAEITFLRKPVDAELQCMRAAGIEAEKVTLPSGRPAVRGGDPGHCGVFDGVTTTEAGPLRELTAATARCAGLPAGDGRSGSARRTSTSPPPLRRPGSGCANARSRPGRRSCGRTWHRPCCCS